MICTVIFHFRSLKVRQLWEELSENVRGMRKMKGQRENSRMQKTVERGEERYLGR